MLARIITATDSAAAATTGFAAVRGGIVVAAGVQLAGEIVIEMIRLWRGHGYRIERERDKERILSAAATAKWRYRRENGRGIHGNGGFKVHLTARGTGS